MGVDFSKIQNPLITLAQLAREHSSEKIKEVSRVSQSARTLLQDLMREDHAGAFNESNIVSAINEFTQKNGDSLKIGHQNKLALLFVQLDKIFELKASCEENEYSEAAFDDFKETMKELIIYMKTKFNAEAFSQIEGLTKKWGLKLDAENTN